MTHVIFIGPQGSGKGTQAAAVAPQLNLVHLATGDLLRELMASASPLADEVRVFYDAGNLVPDDLMVRVLFSALDEVSEGKPAGAIFDGFPRNQAQSDALDRQVEDRHESLAAVVHIDVPRAVLIERISGRLVCRDCGRTYHRTFRPPATSGVCDVCGGDLYQRSDDTEEAVSRRLEIYYSQTQPLLDLWRDRNLVLDIDGNQGIDVVAEAIVAVLRPRLMAT